MTRTAKKNHVQENPLGGRNKCFRCGQFSCSGTYLICKKRLDNTVTKSSTELILPENTQTEAFLEVTTTKSSTEPLPEDAQTDWDDLCAGIKELRVVPDTDNSGRIGLCNTPIERKKVNLQPSPSPPPAVPLPQIRDHSPGPGPSQGDGVLVAFLAGGTTHDHHSMSSY